MAGGGVGEAMLIGAAVGAGTGAVGSAVQDKDPLQGALLGAVGGAATGGLGSAFGGAGSAAATAGEQAVEQGTQAAMTDAVTSSAVPAAIGGDAPASVMGETGINALYGAPSTSASAGTSNILSPNYGLQSNLQGAAGMSGQGAQNVASAYGAAGTPINPSDVSAAASNSGGIAGLTPAQVSAAKSGAISGAFGSLGAQQDQTTPPGQEPYTGPLSKFKMAGPSLSQYNYDPNAFQPSIAPGYAEGGIADLQNSSMYPQSQYQHTAFNMPSQTPISSNVLRSDYDSMPDGYQEVMMARGGIADLGSYSDGGRLLRGPGDGMSDDIPASIAGKQPARLADGEFVVPADVVSHLGNGSTDAGAKTLYGMMDKVRKARTGSKKQGRDINPDKYMPKMACGGIAALAEGGETSAAKDTEQTVEVPQAVYNPSVYNPKTYAYTPYTQAHRPSGDAPQYYGNIYKGFTPDYSTPGYTLTGGNLGRWSNVAGEAQRAAQPASLNQQVTQSYLQNLGRGPDQSGFNYWMNSGQSAPKIQESIRLSPESYQTGNISADEYINRLYASELQRAPDQAGLSYWKSQMEGGMNPYEVMQNMQNSAEYKKVFPQGKKVGDPNLVQQLQPNTAPTVKAKTVQDLIDASLSKIQTEQPSRYADQSQYMTTGGG